MQIPFNRHNTVLNAEIYCYISINSCNGKPHTLEILPIFEWFQFTFCRVLFVFERDYSYEICIYFELLEIFMSNVCCDSNTAYLKCISHVKWTLCNGDIEFIAINFQSFALHSIQNVCYMYNIFSYAQFSIIFFQFDSVQCDIFSNFK